MKIMVARIPEEGSQLEGDDPGLMMELDEDPSVQSVGDVRYDVHVQQVSEELVVRGTLRLALDLKCARCSQFFSTTVTDSDFVRAYPASKDTESVDTTMDFRENLLLHLPAFPVCNEGCKGLCAQCGADLNKGFCACEKQERPNPWSALDNLDF